MDMYIKPIEMLYTILYIHALHTLEQKYSKQITVISPFYDEYRDYISPATHITTSFLKKYAIRKEYKTKYYKDISPTKSTAIQQSWCSMFSALWIEVYSLNIHPSCIDVTDGKRFIFHQKYINTYHKNERTKFLLTMVAKFLLKDVINNIIFTASCDNVLDTANMKIFNPLFNPSAIDVNMGQYIRNTIEYEWHWPHFIAIHTKYLYQLFCMTIERLTSFI